MFSTSLSRYDIAVGLPPVQSFRRRTPTGHHQNPTPPDPMPRPLSPLNIAGSDPRGPAGLQAHLQNFPARGTPRVHAGPAPTPHNTPGLRGEHVLALGVQRT